MTLHLKRVYDAPSAQDGYRVLVDRLWPRGLSKNVARVDLWARDVAPSNELRKWSDHEPRRWLQFRKRYGAEIEDKETLLKSLRDLAKSGRVTLLYGSRETRYNNAMALKLMLEKSRAPKSSR